MPKIGQPISSRVEALKRQAAGRWPELLSELGGVPSEVLDGRNHPCPKCGGTDRFRLIDVEAGALYCNQCFNHDNGDGIAALRWLTGWTFPEAVNALAEYMAAGNSKPATTNGKPRIVATYDYRDEQAKLLYQVARFDPKDFRQRRLKPDGGWEWSVKGVRQVPYRLPELLAAPAGGRVVIVEGEKDVDRLTKLGIVATTNSGGAGKWRPECAEYFRGLEAVIHPDNDAAGRKHVQQVAESLYGIAASIKVVELPGVPEKGDISDWLDHGGTKNKLAELVKAAPEWKPPPADKGLKPATERDEAGPPPYVPFPTSAMPSVVANFIHEGAAALGCDESYVALPLLAGLASAVGNSRRICLKQTWCEPAMVWAVIVGESGTHKSPAFELAMKPIYRVQDVAMQRHKKAMGQFSREKKLYELDLAEWKRNGCKKGEPEPPAEPVAARYYCEDTTVEALAGLLAQQPRGLLMARDELSGWVNSFDAYKSCRGADVAHWLSMHGAGSLTVDRKTGQRLVHVPRAAVSIAGTVQPRALAAAMIGHFENGLAARLLFAMPPREAKRWTDDELPRQTQAALETLVRRLLALDMPLDQNGQPEPRDIPLSREGKRAWVTFYNDHACEQADLTGDLAAAWSKLEGYAARFALLVHLVRLESGDQTLTDPGAVDEQSIAAGVTLARWFGEEAARVYAVIGGDQESPEAREQRELLRIIRDRGGEITVRGLMQASRRYRASAEEAEAALQDMVTAGMGHWRNVNPSTRGGRPTRIFTLGNGGNGNGTPQKPGNGEVPLPLPSGKTKPAAPTGLAARLREAGF